MIIDTHCHIDMYENPLSIAQECERQGIIAIGMTNLPSHFEMGYPYLKNFKKVRLALGMHPLHAEEHTEEYNLFLKYLQKTSYIGEVGLDFSREGIATKEIQEKTFEFILENVKDKKKILSIHSRGAEKEVLNYLKKHQIPNAIFHWYSGNLTLIKEITDAGYYLSINTAMIKSIKGQQIISKIPQNYLLTESDGPFIENNKSPIKPKDIPLIYSYLSSLWHYTNKDIETLIQHNFYTLINKIK